MDCYRVMDTWNSDGCPYTWDDFLEAFNEDSLHYWQQAQIVFKCSVYVDTCSDVVCDITSHSMFETILGHPGGRPLHE